MRCKACDRELSDYMAKRHLLMGMCYTCLHHTRDAIHDYEYGLKENREPDWRGYRWSEVFVKNNPPEYE